MLYSLLDSFEDVIVLNGELHPRISHLQGGMDAFHWRKAWLRREKRNREDPFAVTMKRGTDMVGHVPRTISCVCTLFLRQRVFVSCEVTQARRKQFKGGQAKAKQYLQQLYMWCCGVDTACGPMP